MQFSLSSPMPLVSQSAPRYLKMFSYSATIQSLAILPRHHLAT
ncbi:hypothetical protein ACK36Q_14115 [Aeromonas veronii]